MVYAPDSKSGVERHVGSTPTVPIMNLNEYQQQAKETAIYPKDVAASYLALGVAGEAGEVAEEVKKCLRRGYLSDGSDFPNDRLKNLYEELGDVLWYVANLCSELDFRLEDVAKFNIDKLKERHSK